MARTNWAGATAVNPVLRDWGTSRPSPAKSLVKSSPQPHSDSGRVQPAMLALITFEHVFRHPCAWWVQPSDQSGLKSH